MFNSFDPQSNVDYLDNGNLTESGRKRTLAHQDVGWNQTVFSKSFSGTNSAMPDWLSGLLQPMTVDTGEPKPKFIKPQHGWSGNDPNALSYSTGFRKRKRTGSPVVDGLTGVEPNPGPPKRNPRKQVQKIVREEKKLARMVKAPKRRARQGQGKTVSGPTSIGTATRRNFHKIGKVDGLAADCIKDGGINVQGTCFSNLGAGYGTAAGDTGGLFLDGSPAPHAVYIAFNFQDFDDRVAALATTHQYYRVRQLVVEYVPLVGTTETGQWAFSVNDNYQPSEGSYPQTLNSLLTSAVSAAGSPWVPNFLPPYVYNGSKVWSCASTQEDTSNANTFEQLCFMCRYLATSTHAAAVETGRFQFHYSIDFFEPRGNRGTITAKNIDWTDVRLFLGDRIIRDCRYNRHAWRLPMVKALRSVATELECSLSKDDEDSFVMEQNPLTQSLHIPKNIADKLVLSLKQ